MSPSVRQGLDLDGLSRAGKFSFVDGLTGLLSGGQGSESTKDKGRVIKSGKLEDVRRGIEAAIGDVRPSAKVLIVDQLDELLAISGEEDATALALEGMLFSLREVSFMEMVLVFSAPSYGGKGNLYCRLDRANMTLPASPRDNTRLLR